MEKMYILGYYDSDTYKLCDLIDDREYFRDANLALKSVRENIMDHFGASYFYSYNAVDFKKWMDIEHKDLWYPKTEEDLTNYTGMFSTYLDTGSSCYWFKTMEI